MRIRTKIVDGVAMRDLDDELRDFGLTEQQVIEVMMWTESLPMRIKGSYIKAEINWGIVEISELPKPDVFDKLDS